MFKGIWIDTLIFLLRVLHKLLTDAVICNLFEIFNLNKSMLYSFNEK